MRNPVTAGNFAGGSANEPSESVLEALTSVYVADGKTGNRRSSPKTVTPIRIATNTTLKPITVGTGPVAIAITPGPQTAGPADSRAGQRGPIPETGLARPRR